MKKALAIILTLTALLLFTCSCGTANGDLSGSVFTEDGIGKYLTGCYLRVDGIEGNNNSAAHAKWIDVIDFDLGVKRDKDTSSTTVEPLVIVHNVDSASPKIQKYCAAGRLISEIKLEKTKTVAGKEQVTFTVTLQNACITSAQITCDTNGNVVETVEFTYESATIAYTPIADDGSVGTTVTETISRKS